MLEKVFGLVPITISFGLVGDALRDEYSLFLCLEDGKEDCVRRALIWSKRRGGE